MSFVPGSKVWIDGPLKSAVTLGALLKSGGAGSVFLIREMPAQVAKIYHRELALATYERKLKAMLLLTPNLPDINEAGNRFVQIAWPQSILRDDRGRFIGFTMPSLDIKATSELEYIMQERQARAEGLPIGLGTKITLAANLSAVIAELHRQHHYVVDMKPVNLRFYRQSLYMAMLDCDGFSIQGQGERFEAPQFTPDYLAPEFHLNGIDAAGEEDQDRFALAVVIFQLLNFGIHPFTGKPNSDHVPTDIPGRIAARCYAYGLKPHKAITPSMVSGHETMNTRLRHLFDRAFESTGASRPSATEWANALKQFAQKSTGSLVVCKTDKEHQHFVEHTCAACARENLLKKARQATRNPPAVKQHPTMRPALRQSPRVATKSKRSLRNLRSPVPVKHRHKSIAKSAPYPFKKYVPIYTPPSSQFSHWTNWKWFYGLPIAVIAVLFFLISRFEPSGGSSNQPNEFGRTASEEIAYQHAVEEWRRVNLKKVVEAEFVAAPDLDETGRLANEAANAMAAGDVGTGKTAIAEFMRVASTHRGPLASSTDRHNSAMSEYVSSRDMTPEMIDARQKKMIQHFNHILSLDPLAVQTAEELAWLYAMNKKMPDAKAWFLQTLWGQPENASAWYGLGISELEAGNDDAIIGMFVIAELFLYQKNAEPGGRSAKNQPRSNASRSIIQSRIEYLYYQLPPTEKKKFTVLKVRAQQLVDELLGNGFQFGEDKPAATEVEATQTQPVN